MLVMNISDPLIRKIIRIILLIILVIACVMLPFSIATYIKSKKSTNKAVELEYWGFNIPEEVMNVLIKSYEEKNPNVKIKYVEKDFKNVSDYKSLLLGRLKNKTGPDIFRMHSTWTGNYYAELSRNNPMSIETVNNRFYPAVDNYIIDNKKKVLAIPIMYDGISLYYNKNILESAGLKSPTTWDELLSISKFLTKYEEKEKEKIIVRSGVALGTSDNIDNSSDIIAILLLQNGVSIPKGLDSTNSTSAFTYYGDFSKKYNIWNANMPNSLAAFASQQVAMVFATSQQMLEVLEINPTLNVGSAKIPQLPAGSGSTTNVSWADFWVESVSADSTNAEQVEAWKFLDWLSQPEQQISRFEETSKYKAYGEPYSDMSISKNLLNSVFLSQVVLQAPYAVTSELASGGGNLEYSKLVDDLINEYNKELNYDFDKAVSAFKVSYEDLVRKGK